MENALLMLLKWCLLALVYLFFFRVLQATWSGLATDAAVRSVGGSDRKAKQGKRTKSSGRTPTAVTAPRLVVLEPPGEAGREFQVLGEMTIGRAAGCNIPIEDTFISQLHARVVPSGDGVGVRVEDLGSTNGTYVNRHKVTVPALAGRGDRIQFGGVVMELR